jgi:hypothetical protein
VSSAGNTTVTLPDSTWITFIGVASAADVQGHMFSA